MKFYMMSVNCLKITAKSRIAYAELEKGKGGLNHVD